AVDVALGAWCGLELSDHRVLGDFFDGGQVAFGPAGVDERAGAAAGVGGRVEHRLVVVEPPDVHPTAHEQPEQREEQGELDGVAAAAPAWMEPHHITPRSRWEASWRCPRRW